MRPDQHAAVEQVSAARVAAGEQVVDQQAEGDQVGEGRDEHEADRDLPPRRASRPPRAAMTSAASTMRLGHRQWPPRPDRELPRGNAR